MSDARSIRAERVALFTKSAGVADFAWLRSGAVAPRAEAIAIVLGRLAAQAGAFAAAVLRAAEQLWLIHTFDAGTDFRGRGTTGVAVLRLLDELPQSLWPSLAYRAQRLPPATPDEAPERLIPIGEARQPPPPSPALVARALAAQPLVLTPDEMLGLLWFAPGLLEGVCVSAEGRTGGGAIAWDDVLLGLACHGVRGGPPADALAVAAAQRFHEPELVRLLGAVPASARRLVLAWSGRGPLPHEVLDDPSGRSFLLAFRRSETSGRDLALALSRDADGHRLVGDLIACAAADGLGVEALTLFRALQGTGPVEAPPAAWQELEAAGWLQEPRLVEPPRWLGRHSRHAPRAAVTALLQVLLVPEPEARALLDLPPASNDRPSPIRLALSEQRRAGLGLPDAPAGVAALLLDTGGDEGASLAEAWGAWGAGVHGLRQGQLPDPELVSRASVIDALAWFARRGDPEEAVRRRVVGVLGLAARSGDEGLRAWVTELRSREPELVEAGLDALLAARLGDSPPVSAPLALVDLAARAGLITEACVIPEPASLNRLAALWPATRGLVGLLAQGGVDAGAAETNPGLLPAEPPRLPVEWTRAVASALEPGAVRRWIGAEGDGGARHRWLADVFALTWRPNTHAAAARWLAAPAGIRGVLAEGLGPAGWVELVLLAMPESVGEADAVAAAEGSPALLAGERELLVHALCGRGPLPSLEGCRLASLVSLLPRLDPAEVLDARIRATSLAGPVDAFDAALLGAVAVRGTPPPARGYTALQTRRHLALVTALSHLPGWEGIAPSTADRRAFATDLLKRLDIAVRDLADGDLSREEPDAME